jgi:hypothetical protein
MTLPVAGRTRLFELESTEAAADISLNTSDLENFVERLADYAHQDGFM